MTYNHTQKNQQGLVTVIVLVTAVLAFSIFSIVLQFLVTISQSSNELARLIQQKNTNRAGIIDGAIRLQSFGQLSDVDNKTTTLSPNQSYTLSINRTPYISLLQSKSSDKIGAGSSTSSQGLYVPTAQNSLKAIRSISAGHRHTCAIADGQAYCWGENAEGELGTSDRLRKLVPTKVTGPLAKKYTTHISAGYSHTCAIADGKVYCWGDGGSSKLGISSIANADRPIEVGGALTGKVATHISAGKRHTCAVAEGKAYCWGDGGEGKLGDGTQFERTTPTPVGGALAGIHVTHISVGDWHTCAIADHRAYCWGRGDNGRLGDDSPIDYMEPELVRGTLENKTVTDISAGGDYTCAVADGRAFCWGRASEGRLGTDTNTNLDVYTPTPIIVSGSLNRRVVTQISAGTDHACALADGNTFCWGSGSNGRLGDGTSARRIIATPVKTAADGLIADSAVSITAGADHSCAISRGNIYCWGSNQHGQIGDNTYNDSTSPKKAQSPRYDMSYYRKAVATSTVAGEDHTCAIVEGKVYCWGANDQGQLGAGHTSPVSGVVHVSGGSLGDKLVTKITAGEKATCALAENRVHCWGLYAQKRGSGSSAGRSNSPTLLRGTIDGKSVSDISMRHNFGCAVADGKSHCWGHNEWGQFGQGSSGSTGHSTTTVATDTSGALNGKYITKISTGYHHTCAIASNRAYCWGKSQGGRLGDSRWGHADHEYKQAPVMTVTQADGYGDIPASGTFTDIIAGYAHTCAIVSGKFYCWGYNNWWQIGDFRGNVHWRPVKVNDTGVLAGKTAQSLTAHETGTCGIASGTLICWGGNEYGEHGVGNTSISKNPRSVNTGPTSSIKNKTIVAASMSMSRSQHTMCAVDSTGDIHCWGQNKYHQLGYPGGHNNSTMIPRQINHTFPEVFVPKYADISFTQVDRSISVSRNAACSINLANILGCWGVNINGTLGTGIKFGRHSGFPVPTASQLLTKNADQVAVGGGHACALAEGKVYCWGFGKSGQLGHSKGKIFRGPFGETMNSEIPQLVEGALSGKVVTQITAGGDHTCALAEGKLYCWGSLPEIVFGGTTFTYHETRSPVEIAYGDLAGKRIRQISAGYRYTCALAENNVYCWGRNDKGQLGDGTTQERATPVLVKKSTLLAGAVYISSISTGDSHACLIANGRTYCWGSDEHGQIGRSSAAGSFVTAPAISLGNPDLYNMTATRVSAGTSHTCAIVDGKVYCWGNNSRGQLGFTLSGGTRSTNRAEQASLSSDPNRTASRISSGSASNCALSYRDLMCWGDNSNSLLGDGTENNYRWAITTPGVAEKDKVLRY